MVCDQFFVWLRASCWSLAVWFGQDSLRVLTLTFLQTHEADVSRPVGKLVRVVSFNSGKQCYIWLFGFLWGLAGRPIFLINWCMISFSFGRGRVIGYSRSW